jgi:YfiH family protein
MDLFRIVENIEWCGDTATIPSWSRRGFAHGFDGKSAKPAPYYHVKQVHGVRVVEAPADAPFKLGEGDERVEADGIFTRQKGVPIAVKTADCLPILLRSDSMVMALHAGWRSLAGGIVSEGLKIILEPNVRKDKLNIALGPCIGPASFEVGPEVIEQFAASPEAISRPLLSWCVTKGGDDRWFFDLAMYAILVLVERGIAPQQISALRSCTFQKSNLWQSYRRDAGSAGRIWNWIAG